MKKLMMALMLGMSWMVFAYETWTDPETGIEWTYTVSDGEASVGYYGAWDDKKTAVPQSTEGEIAIPSSLGGYPVTSIGESAFFGCSGLSSVTIPEGEEGVTSIGDEAFRGCSSLTSVTIPSSVTSIGELAFARCAITSITLPGFECYIGDQAFCECQCLTSVVVTGCCDWDDLTFANCHALRRVTYAHCYFWSDDSVDYSSVFLGCDRLTEIDVVGSLWTWALDNKARPPCEYDLYTNNVKVVDIEVPRYLRYPEYGDSEYDNPEDECLGNFYSFRNCRSIKSVVFQEGVRYACDFSDCKELVMSQSWGWDCPFSGTAAWRLDAT